MRVLQEFKGNISLLKKIEDIIFQTMFVLKIQEFGALIVENNDFSIASSYYVNFHLEYCRKLLPLRFRVYGSRSEFTSYLKSPRPVLVQPTYLSKYPS